MPITGNAHHTQGHHLHTPLPDPRYAHEHPHPVRSARDGRSGEGRKGSAGEWRMAGGGRVMGGSILGGNFLNILFRFFNQLWMRRVGKLLKIISKWLVSQSFQKGWWMHMFFSNHFNDLLFILSVTKLSQKQTELDQKRKLILCQTWSKELVMAGITAGCPLKRQIH